jgi:ribosomal protein L27
MRYQLSFRRVSERTRMCAVSWRNGLARVLDQRHYADKSVGLGTDSSLLMRCDGVVDGPN